MSCGGRLGDVVDAQKEIGDEKIIPCDPIQSISHTIHGTYIPRHLYTIQNQPSMWVNIPCMDGMSLASSIPQARLAIRTSRFVHAQRHRDRVL